VRDRIKVKAICDKLAQCLTALGSGKDYICGQAKIRRHGRALWVSRLRPKRGMAPTGLGDEAEVEEFAIQKCCAPIAEWLDAEQ
jgi:hypothetical protein